MRRTFPHCGTCTGRTLHGGVLGGLYVQSDILIRCEEFCIAELYAVNIVVWYNESGVGLVCLCGGFGCFGFGIFYVGLLVFVCLFVIFGGFFP